MKTLFSKGDREFDRARLNIAMKTMFSGDMRVVVWKTSPDGQASRGQIAYYNLHTGSVVESAGTFNYPEIDFGEEMKMFAEDPEKYESLFNDDLGYDTEQLLSQI